MKTTINWWIYNILLAGYISLILTNLIRDKINIYIIITFAILGLINHIYIMKILAKGIQKIREEKE